MSSAVFVLCHEGGEMDCPWWRAVCSVTSCSTLTQMFSNFCPMIVSGDEFINPVWINNTNASSPEDHSILDVTCDHRLLELQHLGAYIKRSELPQKNEYAWVSWTQHLCWSSSPVCGSSGHPSMYLSTLFNSFSLLTHDVYINPVVCNFLTLTKKIQSPLHQCYYS